MDYYIRDKAQPEGPYDLMAIIRKIRNGAIKETTALSGGLDGPLKPAVQFAELEGFFRDSDPDDVVLSRSPAYRKSSPSFLFIIQRHMDYVLQNLSIAIYSGVFMVLWLVLGYLVFASSVIASFIGVVASYFILGAYFYGLHKFVRGNPIQLSDMLKAAKTSAVQMLIAAGIFAVTLLPGLAFLHGSSEESLPIVLPLFCGLVFIVMTFFSYVPLLVVQKQAGAIQAIKASVNATLAGRGENLGILFALTTLNFLLLPLLPLVLPITSCAIADLYDEYIG